MLRTACILIATACASTPSAEVREPAPVPRVVTETPYAVYELLLPTGGHLRLPATGTLQCSISPEGAFALTRSRSWIEVEGVALEGWSMLRIVHDTGARSLYRFYTPPREPRSTECSGGGEGATCIDLDVGEQETYPTDGVRSYSQSGPGFVEIRLTDDHFVFAGVAPGATSLLLIMSDGSQRALRIDVHDPSEARGEAPRLEAPRNCSGGCDAGECVEGTCATWAAIECVVP